MPKIIPNLLLCQTHGMTFANSDFTKASLLLSWTKSPTYIDRYLKRVKKILCLLDSFRESFIESTLNFLGPIKKSSSKIDGLNNCF